MNFNIGQIVTQEQLRQIENAALFQIATSTLMLFYFLVLVSIKAFKYKVYGFLFRMLIGLGVEVLAVLIAAILTFKVDQLIADGDESQLKNKVGMFYALLGAQLVVSSVGPSLCWKSALKYWSVALKFQLAVKEQDITSKAKLVNTFLFTGLAYIIFLSLASVMLFFIVPNALRLAKAIITLFLLAMLMCCLLLLDAFYRMYSTKIQNNAISLKSVIILGTAFFSELVSIVVSVFILFGSGKITNIVIAAFYAIQVTFMIAFVILGHILFKIGVIAAQTYSQEDKAEFQVNEIEELLSEDDELTGTS